MRTGLHRQAGRGRQEGGRRAAVVLVGALALRRAHDVHLRASARITLPVRFKHRPWVMTILSHYNPTP